MFIFVVIFKSLPEKWFPVDSALCEVYILLTFYVYNYSAVLFRLGWIEAKHGSFLTDPSS